MKLIFESGAIRLFRRHIAKINVDTVKIQYNEYVGDDTELCIINTSLRTLLALPMQ